MTNVTLVFNTTQAFWAANAGATYISPFLGRVPDYIAKNDKKDLETGNSLYWLDDAADAKDKKSANSEYVASGGERRDAGARLIFEISTVFANYQITTEILAASIRNPVQLTECLLAGADILTVPAPVLQTVANHPLSDEGMRGFLEDSKAFSG
jgi:transaldolase